jgi:hypothetical protein
MASDNPFNYSEWLRRETSTSGSSGTGEDVELGRRNYPDQHEGTQIFGVTPNNVVFAAAYLQPAESAASGAGVYGAGSGDRGIGVAGTCDAHGVGVYGMALDEGIGVVGRQMAGTQGEMIPPPVLLGRTAGVLGHAQDGVGVYGHGGYLIPWLDSDDTGNPPPPQSICCRRHLQCRVAHVCGHASCLEASTRERLEPSADSVASEQ